MTEYPAQAALDVPEVKRLFADSASGVELLPDVADLDVRASVDEGGLVEDPATGQVIARVQVRGAVEMRAAIDHAERAFPDWRNRLAEARRAALRAWAAAVRRESAWLAKILSAEQGKPLNEAEAEINYGVSFIDWFADEAIRVSGQTLAPHKPASMGWVSKQPIGITVAITPWNFPMAMIARKTAAALAAGCPVIVKPAPETPLSAFALVTLAKEAGIPDGVFQVIHGDGERFAGIIAGDSRVRAVSFTGSTAIGKILYGQSAATVKKLSMELGGHAPLLVFDDVDLDATVEACMAAKFATSGQDCLAANRIYVQRKLYHAFCDRFAGRVAALRVGHGLLSDTDIGPMTKAAVADKCRAQIDDAVRRGARVLAGGGEIDGNFVTPTALCDVADDMLIAREETFGPVAAILPFDTEAEVIGRANASEMGLAAYVFTADLNRAIRCSAALEYGMVAVNTPSFTGPPVPFGGWKESGLGREGSTHGIDEFLELKYVCVGDLARGMTPSHAV